MEKYLLTALFAPLVSSLLCGVFATSKKSVFVGIMASFLVLVSTISSFVLLGNVLNFGSFSYTFFEFIKIENLDINYSFVIDEVSVIMMVVVGVVSTLVHIYSIGYMEYDEGFNRYFSYLSAFVFSMLILVMSDNFLGLFIGWEGVGICSWLLIGFWYEKDSATWSANEAFIMNRIADLGLLVAIFLIFYSTGSLKYGEVFANIHLIDNFTLNLIGITLFIGAMGKSAQFPFHTWLADAMEGPTPVSALIHAATMVTAGVYLVVRANPVYSQILGVSNFIVYLGAFVAVFAASMAVVNNDLKKIIAYSTLSQLGYMFVAAGLGAYSIALFHLVTHAFFKSLLFLGAGNVMHAMNDELNIKKMGGLYKALPNTAILMAIGSLALCGIYPFAGFFSKDKILEAAFSSDYFVIWAILLIGACLTAFYSFRLIMLVFFTRSKFSHHPHEAKNYMLLAMLPLGILAIIAGFMELSFANFVGRILPNFDINLSSNLHLALIFGTLAVVIISILFAIFAYKKDIFSYLIEQNFLHRFLSNEYFIPKFYSYIVFAYSKICYGIACFDRYVVDGFVNFISNFIYKLGLLANQAQRPDLSHMLRFMVIGFVMLLAIAILV